MTWTCKSPSQIWPNLLQPEKIDFEVALVESERLSPRQTHGCVRIVQEALTNVLRHYQANLCRITGKPDTDGHCYSLAIADKEQGVALAQDSEGNFALPCMRERAHLLGGNMLIKSARSGIHAAACSAAEYKLEQRLSDENRSKP